MASRPPTSHASGVFLSPPDRRPQSTQTRPSGDRDPNRSTTKNSTHPSVTLLSLPPELLCEVASYLDEDDIMKVRRVCRELEAATCDHFARLFFSENSCLFTERMLRRLVDITSQPRFAKAIQSIHFVPLHMYGTSKDIKLIHWPSTVTPLDIEDHEWHETGNEYVESPLGSHSQVNDEHEEFEAYDSAYGQQYGHFGMASFTDDSSNSDDNDDDEGDDVDDDETIDDSDDDGDSEQMGPPKPKQQWQILKLTEAKGNWLKAERGLHEGGLVVELLTKIFDNIITSGNDVRLLFAPDEPRACYGSAALAELLGCSAAMHYVTSKISPSRVLQAVHQASARSEEGLSRLCLDLYRLDELGSEAFSMPLDLPTGPWSRLKELRLDMLGFRDCSEDGTHHALASLLRSAVALDTLNVQFSTTSAHENKDSVSFIVGNIPPSAPLQRLCLAYNDGLKETLLPFLLRYSKTLAELCFHNSTFSTEDDWTEVLETLADDFQLEQMEIRALRIPNRHDPTHEFHHKGRSDLTFSGREEFRQSIGSLLEEGHFVSLEEE